MADNHLGDRNSHIVSASIDALVITEVIDKGRGLPVEPEKISEAFYPTQPEGLGMGLAICRSIIQAHQGQLWAETNSQDGSTSHIVLPAMEGELSME